MMRRRCAPTEGGSSTTPPGAAGLAIEDPAQDSVLQGQAPWPAWADRVRSLTLADQAEILAQRTRIGELLGQIRDLEAEWTEEAVHRITTENTTLKQCVRQLNTDNRTLGERLKAACSNLRIQDRRVADLEARLIGLR
ncbi:hypothetical protein [Streptomyces sp. NPDC002676]